MKDKRNEKKLRLRRESLRALSSLGDQALRGVAGGSLEDARTTGVLMSRTCRIG